ncbi:MAG: peptidoglycan bridge formation glycyltransferase FemA/FemB family protein [Candidatus Sungbacteria bacterium]|nr:peptidoglycan bridge formation glycyltransferase FemA/FemB family protein [bacterium]MDZ4260673.1 peptidoglycan bridge formation glycyltransferase FemA/FemB family protein [Candidatus Sungbacteria bacterium]
MNGAFLQSPEWEHVHQEMGRKTWRVQGVLVIRHNIAKGFNYLYCPRPALDRASLKEFFAEVRQIAKIEKSLFLKIDPLENISFENIPVRASASESLQPQKTVMIDLSKSEDELLSSMHEKTRYNIRLAERKNVAIHSVIHREAKEDFPVFWDMMVSTSEREHFSLHEKRYYQLLASIRGEYISNEFFFAHIRDDHNTMLASAMVNFHHDARSGVSIATYLHGASSREKKELMAPHLLHWRIIQEAKRRNFDYYDFWGIDEVKWPGFTRFKMGFGGTVVSYPPSVDIVYRPLWYHMYRLIKKSK